MKATTHKVMARNRVKRDAGISVFAARHAELPLDDNGALFEMIRPD